MKKLIIGVVIALFAISCVNVNGTSEVKNDSTKVDSVKVDTTVVLDSAAVVTNDSI